MMEWLAVTEVTEGKNIPPTSDRGLSRNMVGLEETVDFLQGVYRRHRVVQNHTQHQDRQTACEIQNFQMVMEEMQVFLGFPCTQAHGRIFLHMNCGQSCVATASTRP